MLCLNTQECCFFILVNHALNIRWKTHFCGHWKIIAGRWSKHFELIIKQYIFLSFFFRFMYDILPVSMPFSPIIPPSPSPTESKRLFYTSVSLLLSRIQGYRYHLSKFLMYASVYCIGIFLSAFFLSFFLTSLWFLESLGVFHWFDITQRSISLPICFLNMRDYFGNSYL